MSGKKIYDWEFGLFERSWGRRGVACPDCVNESNVSIRWKPYSAPRKSFAPLHRDFKMFKLWYKARKHSTTGEVRSPSAVQPSDKEDGAGWLSDGCGHDGWLAPGCLWNDRALVWWDIIWFCIARWQQESPSSSSTPTTSVGVARPTLWTTWRIGPALYFSILLLSSQLFWGCILARFKK